MLNLSQKLDRYREACQILAEELIPSNKDPQFNAKHPREPDGRFAKKSGPTAEGVAKVAIAGVVAGLGVEALGYFGNRRHKLKKANVASQRKAKAAAVADNLAQRQRDIQIAADLLAEEIRVREQLRASRAAAKARKEALAERRAVAKARRDQMTAKRQARHQEQQSAGILAAQARRAESVKSARDRRYRGQGLDPNAIPSEPIAALRHQLEDHFFEKAGLDLAAGLELERKLEQDLPRMVGGLQSQLASMRYEYVAGVKKPDPARIAAIDRNFRSKLKQQLAAIADIGKERDDSFSATSMVGYLSTESLSREHREAGQILLDVADEIDRERRKKILPPAPSGRKVSKKNKLDSPTRGKGFAKN